MAVNSIPLKDRLSAPKTSPDARGVNLRVSPSNLEGSSLLDRISPIGASQASNKIVGPVNETVKRNVANEDTRKNTGRAALDRVGASRSGSESLPSRKSRRQDDTRERNGASGATGWALLANAINESVRPPPAKKGTAVARNRRTPPALGSSSRSESSLAYALDESRVTSRRSTELTAPVPEADVTIAPADYLSPPRLRGSDSTEIADLMYPSSPDRMAYSADSSASNVQRSLGPNSEEVNSFLQTVQVGSAVPSAADEASAFKCEEQDLDMKVPTGASVLVTAPERTPQDVELSQISRTVAGGPQQTLRNLREYSNSINSISSALERGISLVATPSLFLQPSIDGNPQNQLDQSWNILPEVTLNAPEDQNVRVPSPKGSEDFGATSELLLVSPKHDGTHASPSRDSLFSVTPPPSSPEISQRTTRLPSSVSPTKLSQVSPNRFRLDHVAVPPVTPQSRDNILLWPSTQRKKRQRPISISENLASVMNSQAQHNDKLTSQVVKFGPPRRKKAPVSDKAPGERCVRKRKRSETVDPPEPLKNGPATELIVISDNSTDGEAEPPPLPAPYYEDDISEPILTQVSFNETPSWLGPVHCFLRCLKTTFPNLYNIPATIALTQQLDYDERFFGDYAERGLTGPYAPEEEGECSMWSMAVDVAASNENSEIEIVEPSAETSRGSQKHGKEAQAVGPLLAPGSESPRLNERGKAQSPIHLVKRRSRKIGLSSKQGDSTESQSRPQADAETTKLISHKSSQSSRKRQRSPDFVPESESDDEAVVPHLGGGMSEKARGKQKAVESPLQHEPFPQPPESASPIAPLPPAGPAVPLGDVIRISSYAAWLEKGLVPKEYPQSCEALCLLGSEATWKITDELKDHLVRAGRIVFRGFNTLPIIIETPTDYGALPMPTLPTITNVPAPLGETVPYPTGQFDSTDSQDLPTVDSPILPPANGCEPMTDQTTPATIDPSLLGGQQKQSAAEKKATFWNRNKRKSALRTPEYLSDDIGEVPANKSTKRTFHTKNARSSATKTVNPEEVPKKKRRIIGARRDWPRDPNGRTAFCHHCRCTSTRLHMTCTAVCGKSFCQRCIEVKYTGLQFDSEADNWICLICIDRCGCDNCTRKRGQVYLPNTITHLEDEEEEEESQPFPPLPAPPAQLPFNKMVYFGTMYGIQGEVIGKGFATEDDMAIYAECEVLANETPTWRIRSKSPFDYEEKVLGRAIVGLSRPHSDELPLVDLRLLTGQRMYVGNARILRRFNDFALPPLSIDSDPGTPDDDGELTPLPEDMENREISRLFEECTPADTVAVMAKPEPEPEPELGMGLEDIQSVIMHLSSKQNAEESVAL